MKAGCMSSPKSKIKKEAPELLTSDQHVKAVFALTGEQKALGMCVPLCSRRILARVYESQANLAKLASHLS